MKTHLLSIGIATAFSASLLASSAIAGHHNEVTYNLETVNELLDANEITHVVEISWDSGNQLDIEGFTVEGRFNEFSFDNQGELREFERETTQATPWGMDKAQLGKIMAKAEAEGIVEFEEIDINQAGTVEVEGHDKDRQELELVFQATRL